MPKSEKKQKKLRNHLIDLGIFGAIVGGLKYKLSTIKPKPTFSPPQITKQVLEKKLADCFNLENLNIVRYNTEDNQTKFAVLTSYNPNSNNLTIQDIKTTAKSLGELIKSGIIKKLSGGYLKGQQTISQNQLLSPITPKNIIGIAYNYQRHSSEVGEKNTRKFKRQNMVAFRKESSSLTNAFAEIKKPDNVRLLDYEVELGLVIGKKINKDTQITLNNFQEFVAGYVLVNDISARCKQLKGSSLLDKIKGFRKAKSYPGFCPTGPVFVYNSGNSTAFTLSQFLIRNNKHYKLQEDRTFNMLNSPYEIIKELQKRLFSSNEKEYRIFIDKNQKRNFSLDPGDLIITGTPEGVAFNFNIKYIIGCGGKGNFIKFEQQNNDKYLQSEDILIATGENLGYQKLKIK